MSGAEIARIMEVTRQIIIKDIAPLRAARYKINATPKGYAMQKERGIKAVFAVKHTKNQ
jgi:transcriptional regulator of NAD metabolism